MVTVGVDPVHVESRLVAGQIGCPRCGGVLGVSVAGCVAGGRAGRSAIVGRFGVAGLLDAVTPSRLVVAASGGRLLAPGWPPAGGPAQEHVPQPPAGKWAKPVCRSPP